MVLPNPDACYQALLSRDGRFDGRFFVGVSSTGIYCRPICRVRTPRRENCSFFASAAAAEEAGFRPCLRCRPEHAPGRAPVDAAARLAHAAAELLECRLGEAAGKAGVAERIGVSERHLRRLFVAEFGVTPAAYLASRRLQMARRMIVETALPIGDVALAAGFGSLRSFNQRFLAGYRERPSELRRRSAPPADAALAGFRLGYRPPLDWHGLCAFLARRAIPGVEAVAGQGGQACYRRVLALQDGADGIQGWLSVRPAGAEHALLVTLDDALLRRAPTVLARLRRLFDLGCDPQQVAARLGALASGREGLRLPGAADGFELGVRAILGQQISVVAARTLAGRFARCFGRPIETPWRELDRAFPSPARVAALAEDEIAALGMPRARARAVLALARAVNDGRLQLDVPVSVDATRAALLALPGIGPWTAEYILMRGCSWPDALPEGDVGVHRALGESSRSAVRERMEAWRPWRSYAVIHCWRGAEEADDE